MNPLYLNVALFSVGWILFVLLQAQNSVKSKSNGLPAGAAGIWRYIQLQAINLAVRALVSGALYPVIVNTTASKLQAAGLALHAAGVAAIGGLAANAAIYQVSGLLPWLRQEVSDAAPPPNSQIVTPPAPPPSETRS